MKAIAPAGSPVEVCLTIGHHRVRSSENTMLFGSEAHEHGDESERNHIHRALNHSEGKCEPWKGAW